MEPHRPRNALGRFEKGQPAPTGPRRRKGVPNKITSDIRRETIAGFARHGSNGRGEGGLSGFAFYLAKNHPKAAARLLEKVLPLQVNSTGPVRSTIALNIVSIESGDYLSAEDCARYASPAQIEHEPIEPVQPQPEDLDKIGD